MRGLEHRVLCIEGHALIEETNEHLASENEDRSTSSGLSNGLTLFHNPLNPWLSFPFSTTEEKEWSQHKHANITVRGDSLDPLAYAAAATISSNLSLTTGDVLDEDKRSSIVSRNLRDVDWEIKISEELRSMTAQTCSQYHKINERPVDNLNYSLWLPITEQAALRIYRMIST